MRPTPTPDGSRRPPAPDLLGHRVILADATDRGQEMLGLVISTVDVYADRGMVLVRHDNGFDRWRSPSDLRILGDPTRPPGDAETLAWNLTGSPPSFLDPRIDRIWQGWESQGWTRPDPTPRANREPLTCSPSHPLPEAQSYAVGDRVQLVRDTGSNACRIGVVAEANQRAHGSAFDLRVADRVGPDCAWSAWAEPADLQPAPEVPERHPQNDEGHR